jgi:perosamine synthetase
MLETPIKPRYSTMAMIPVNRPLISEGDISAVTDALKNTWISGDTPPTLNLENSLKEILGVSDVVAVSNGTTAIDLSVEALDIESGDECVVPTFTIMSSISNLLRRGATLKVVDSDPVTWSIDANLAAEAITAKTKLIVPVHIYGLPVDMDPILNKVAEYPTFVLEDAAEALGVDYKGRHCGAMGNVGVFSFYANKIVTGGEGGAVVTNDTSFADRVRYFRNLCFNPKQRFVHEDLGWNARLSGIQATLISSQLQRLDYLVERKISIAQRYLSGLAGHPWLEFHPPSTEFSKNTYWVFGVLLNQNCPFNAEELQHKLRTLGIDTRRFFCPIHLQPLAHRYPIKTFGAMPVAEKLWKRGIYLPSGLGNTTEEFDTVIEAMWRLVKE